ncbi:GEVED domain-containing protein [Rosistilla ulvae]|uniref:GEVED domain-containing protein n=1 Tax=Rosistilla ulvae TaxID=1930277 RepID=UPI0011A7155D|nr:GEVED domain-containing protein [Rosistilla ulvae]
MTQDGQSILDSQRQFAVAVGDRFDLELQYDDQRQGFLENVALGAFTVYADILAENAHAYRPVLSETQILSLGENLMDADGGSIQLIGNGRTATIPFSPNGGTTPSLFLGMEQAIKYAIESPEGLDMGPDSVTVFQTGREPRNANGDVGSGDPFDLIVRFVGEDYKFVDAPNLSIDTSGLTMIDNGPFPSAEVREIPIFSDPESETVNPQAFLYNLDARSATLNNQIIYGSLSSGAFDPTSIEVFDELGGTGPLQSNGLRDVAANIFGVGTPAYFDFISSISDVEVFSIELEAIAASKNVNFTLDPADGDRNELSVYGIDVALTPDQVLIDLVNDPATPEDDRYGMAFGTIVERPSVIVAPISGLQTSESGDSQTFAISLGSLPLSDVVIDLSSSHPAEGSLSHTQITLTPENATTPQIITVTGVDDSIDDGDVSYTIITNAIVSADPFYHGLNPDDVALVNVDDDHWGINVSPASGLTTSESGDSDTIAVVLESQPTADVSIELSVAQSDEASLSTSGLTFNSSNWNVPQVVTVTGRNDDVDDGDALFTVITHPAVSADPQYHQTDPHDITGVNVDDDVAGISVSPTSGLLTSEAGQSDSFQIVLDSQPLAAVNIPLSISDASEANLSTSELIFTPENWDTPQTVTATGINDDLADGDTSFTILTSAARSNDSRYDGINALDVTATNQDDDVAGLIYSGVNSLVVDEAGTLTASFSIGLSAIPSAPVTLNLSLNDPSEVSLSQTSIVFTPENGIQPITVDIAGLDDRYDDGDAVVTIITSTLTGDPRFAGFDPANITITNLDDDTAGITVDVPNTPTTTESGDSFTFTVALNTIPTGTVTIPIASSNTGEATVDQASLIFTPGNALTPQTVTVRGVDDAVLDNDQPLNILLGDAISTDPNYQMAIDTIAATNLDNELPPPDSDFGDAPAPYPSLLADNGARHLGSSLFLGTAPTLERDAGLTIQADSSDDGVTFATGLIASDSQTTQGSLRVEASANGKLDAWIDFNQDGDWTDAGEQIATSLAMQPGTNFVPVTIPAGADHGTTYARFRISSTGGLPSVGAAADGEVEDYQVQLTDGAARAEVTIDTASGDTVIQRIDEQIVVSQGANVLFSADHQLFGALQINAPATGDTFHLGDLGPTDSQIRIDGGDGDDTLTPTDPDRNLDQGTLAGLKRIETIDIAGNGSSVVVLDAATVSSISPTTNTLTLRMDVKDIPIFQGDWTVSGHEVDGDEFVQVLTLGNVTVRLSGGGDWTNPLIPLDVNNSGEITPIDALQILNQLYRRDMMVGNFGLVDAAGLSENFPGKYYDTNRDGQLTPVDALRVINHIARNNLRAGEQQMLIPPVPAALHADPETIDEIVFSTIGEQDVDRVLGQPSTEIRFRVDRPHESTPSKRDQDPKEQTDPLEIALAQWPL